MGAAFENVSHFERCRKSLNTNEKRDVLREWRLQSVRCVFQECKTSQAAREESSEESSKRF